MISGGPAVIKSEGEVQELHCAPAARFERPKEFIIALDNIGPMLFHDEYYGRSEKDCMWEEY